MKRILPILSECTLLYGTNAMVALQKSACRLVCLKSKLFEISFDIFMPVSSRIF